MCTHGSMWPPSFMCFLFFTQTISLCQNKLPKVLCTLQAISTSMPFSRLLIIAKMSFPSPTLSFPTELAQMLPLLQKVFHGPLWCLEPACLATYRHLPVHFTKGAWTGYGFVYGFHLLLGTNVLKVGSMSMAPPVPGKALLSEEVATGWSVNTR